jgi:hypothetical protein
VGKPRGSFVWRACTPAASPEPTIDKAESNSTNCAGPDALPDRVFTWVAESTTGSGARIFARRNFCENSLEIGAWPFSRIDDFRNRFEAALEAKWEEKFP